MHAWRQLAAIGVALAVAIPAAATSAAAVPELALRVEHRTDPDAMLERIRAKLSAALPVGGRLTPGGLRLTTTIGGPASRERLEGRLETTTKLVVPQIGCWRAWKQGFFLGLELGWAVASAAPLRSGASDGRRDGGFTGLARPTVSLLHFGWSW